MSEAEAVAQKAWIKRICSDENGATAIEYALICAMIAVVVVGIAATGGALQGVYSKVSSLIPAFGG